MIRFTTLNFSNTLASAFVAAALVLTMAAPAAAEWPAGYQPGRDDNFMRVAEPLLYAAGFILDWVVYRPVHAIMSVVKHEAHPFSYAELGSTQAKVRYVLDRAERADAEARYAARQ